MQTPPSTDDAWKQFQDRAIESIRRSIQHELPNAVTIQILSANAFVVTGPNITKELRADFKDMGPLPAFFQREIISMRITDWLRENLGPEFGEIFAAAAARGWRGKDVIETMRPGEFDGLFVVVTRALGVLVVVAEVKRHKRPVDRQSLESFAHRVRRTGANKGYFVSAAGFQRGAIELARAEGLSLIDVNDGEIEPGAHLKPEIFAWLAPMETPESLAAFHRWRAERLPYFLLHLIQLGFGAEEVGLDSSTFERLAEEVRTWKGD